jgi:4-hydroxy-tetrahydrodipicolinate synthase
MEREEAASRLCGCYVTLPTMFSDTDGLPVDLQAIRRHVRFLVDAGIRTGSGVLLATGAAGDFSTVTREERLLIAETVIDAADGDVPVALGAQTTSTHELIDLACAAEQLGADFIQVSPPFYFAHTEGDFYEYVRAASEAADIGIIVYNTHWTSYGLSTSIIERLIELPNVVGLKWSTPDTGFMEFEQVVSRFADRLTVIDNQLRFVTSHMLGARAIEAHVCTYWPEWGLRMCSLLEQGSYEEAQRELVRVVMPFMMLWREIESYTGGDGYLDKLCMELVGLGSSRCRPPTRDIRDRYRERARAMLVAAGTPAVLETA